ncbi:hypothetical protein J4409_02060 [Candidatus Woesearchaeota archaeon]|nr:hypothetical protein [Candidatus Woesearchaeota archaeon]
MTDAKKIAIKPLLIMERRLNEFLTDLEKGKVKPNQSAFIGHLDSILSYLPEQRELKGKPIIVEKSEYNRMIAMENSLEAYLQRTYNAENDSITKDCPSTQEVYISDLKAILGKAK